MKILVLTNLYPPHHAGTFDIRCQSVVEGLRLRGHEVNVVTSNYGLRGEHSDDEVHRRLHLNGVFEQPEVTDYNALARLETHNHEVLREAIEAFQPEIAHCWSLRGLSKSLIFGLRHSRLPVVFDVADAWIGAELRTDPWLRWWNADSAPFSTKMARRSLDLSGQRGRFDGVAPTRPHRAVDNMTSVFGMPGDVPGVAPDSIGLFQLQHIYFASGTLMADTMAAGLQVSQAEIIHPGVPVETFVGEVKPPESPVQKLLMVADLDERSGLMLALKALAAARQRGARFSVTIHGRGGSDFVARLKSFAVQNDVPAQIQSLSNINRDLPAIYRHHDAFIHAPDWDEPFLSAPLEALACGLPVIASATRTVREVLRDGEEALLFEPGDVEMLRDRIELLLADGSLRHRIAGGGQEAVALRYNESGVLDRIESCLQASLEEWRQA